ncbi:MAG: AmmeMemoRadiSam system protein A [Bifidobacteriaceae bacterium]|jgi:AmmeMemoRadiSam system protein A|nr:AmmeMemoRadiSam system protein A [Bifidobacteriaceae bacterium]
MPHEDPTVDGKEMIALAREAIQGAFAGLEPGYVECPAFFARRAATFVTLTQGGALRGCIGSLEAHLTLGEDIQRNAIDAAFKDPRFPPLTAQELDRIDIEISVLSRPRPVGFASRDELLGRLRPGVDGLILEANGHRGTFLPQVWEQLPTPQEFVSHLVRKAGLPAGYWDDSVRIWRYTVKAFS